ncbi:MAG: T9SS type A sorting domain-containing protein [bacterium]
MKNINKVILSISLIFVCFNFLHAQSTIPSFVIANGGMSVADGTHKIIGTVGQTLIGTTGGTANNVFNGFWYVMSDNISFITPVENLLPEEFSLEQNFPNPFNPSTTIRISVPEPSFVIIKLYDILGAEISTLLYGELNTGVYDLRFDAYNLASGIYIYRMTAGSYIETRKMNLLK